jgi:hypothetical protein
VDTQRHVRVALANWGAVIVFAFALAPAPLVRILAANTLASQPVKDAEFFFADALLQGHVERTRWSIHRCCDVGKWAPRFLAPLEAAFTKLKPLIILRGFRENPKNLILA